MSPGKERGAGYQPSPSDDRHDAGRGTSYPGDDAERALAELRRWETSARLVADDPALSLKQKCLALIEMAFRARRSDMAKFLETAIWRGARHLFEEEPRLPTDTVDAIRRLLRRGHDTCPACRRPLPDHDELDYWRRFGHDLRRPA